MKIPTFEDVSRAFSEHRGGPVPEFVRACPEAEALWRDLEAIQRATRESPVRTLSADELVVREVELLQTVSRLSAGPLSKTWTPSSALAAAGLASIAIAAGITLLVVAQSDPIGEERLGTARVISHTAGARYEHFSTSDPIDDTARIETLRVSKGLLTFKIPDAAPHSRFRIVTDDAEIVLSSGDVEVGVVDGRLMKLRVLGGRAELRREDGGPLMLATGNFWERSPEALAGPPASPEQSRARAAEPASPEQSRTRAAEPSAPERGHASEVDPPPTDTRASRSEGRLPTLRGPRPQRVIAQESSAHAEVAEEARATPATRRTESPTGSPHQTQEPIGARGAPQAANPDELAYADAWSLLQTDHPSRAADRFADVGDGPLAPDALYWRGVALTRARRSSEAEAAFARYLEIYPEADRAYEVTVLVGFLALDRGAREDARIRFQAGLQAPASAVRMAARRGLDALDDAPK